MRQKAVRKYCKEATTAYFKVRIQECRWDTEKWHTPAGNHERFITGTSQKQV